ncbi:MAG: hypothetical protein WAJ85_11700 [Candidatus Baltobacteraceae bacterium]
MYLANHEALEHVPVDERNRLIDEAVRIAQPGGARHDPRMGGLGSGPSGKPSVPTKAVTCPQCGYAFAVISP